MRLPSDAPRDAARALSDLVNALEAAGVTAWITDGTLLGAIRNRAFIPHDQDIDVAAMAEQYAPAIDTTLSEAGFTIRKKLGTRAKGLQHKLRRDDFHLDIFWHYERDDGSVWHAAYDNGGMIAYDYPTLALERISFMGARYWAPSPPRLFLVQKYGMEWRTPVVDWDWAWGPANARRAS